MFFVLGNLFAIFRFVVFSRFNRTKVIFGLVIINITFIPLLLSKIGGVEFSKEMIMLLGVLGIGILFTGFYFINNRK